MSKPLTLAAVAAVMELLLSGTACAASAAIIVPGVRLSLPVVYGLTGGILGAWALTIAIAVFCRVRRARTEADAFRKEYERHCQVEQRLSAMRDELERTLEARASELAQANQELRAEIEKRNRFEITLRASEERYRELFDNAHDLVYQHDLNGHFLAINKAAQRILGYSQNEALALNIEQLLAPEDVELVRSMIVQQLAGEPASHYEVRLVAKTGARLTMELSTHLVFHEGVPAAVQCIARDVTERRRLEDQLRHSQKMEAIGRLAGGLAHDFNNLLTVIGAYSQMILDEARGKPELESYAGEVLAASERAAALTSRLLAFSRRQFLEPQVLSLSRLVLSMDNMLRRLLGEDIELRIALDGGLCPIKADPGQIEQVVMNLAVNARDAMPHGGVLTIATGMREFAHGGPAGREPGTYVTLSVRDTGMGMAPDVISRIFEPFFTTKGPGKGTGLGLSTVYGIVKQSGGEIEVESEPGQGSTFTVYLSPSTEEVPAAEDDHDGAQAQQKPRKRATILLIEDEAGVRRLVRRMLIERGYRVIEASCGEEALAAFETHHPMVDLVLTDVVMPNMCGIEIIKRLSAHTPGLKVLYMTGYSEDVVLERDDSGKSVPLLKKPFQADALERKVRELLDSVR